MKNSAEGWVKVEDELPKDTNMYLICDIWENIKICFYHHHSDQWLIDKKSIQVTHWQPLPSPPETK